MSIRRSPIPRTTLRKLEGLAERALFGTLSESYRTCGQPGCHCHQGQKHGPHLYVSFRGPEGKTTGYYVPQELAKAVREGVAAWQELQARLRDLAEKNRRRLWRSRTPRSRARTGRRRKSASSSTRAAKHLRGDAPRRR
jgi:hypothetical protein